MSKYFVKPKSKIFFILISAVFMLVGWGVLVAGNPALAASGDCPKGQIALQVSLPVIGKCVSGFPEYVQTVYNLFIGIVGILAVVMIMLGGFQWLAAAGNSQVISGAKTTILSAVIGLILALTSYAILDFINPDITLLTIDENKLKSVSGDAWDSGVSTNRYCRSSMNFVKKSDEKYPRCSVQYKIEGSEDNGSCWGTDCDNGRVCIVGQIKTGGCFSNYQIDDKLSDYGNNVWEVEGDARWYNLKHDALCGRLYYIPKGSSWLPFKNTEEKRAIGTHCVLNKTCLINASAGFIFTKSQSEVRKDTFTEVGRFNEAYCY